MEKINIEKISGWKLVKSLGEKNHPFTIGLYKKDKKLAVIKVWTGSKKSPNYFSLKREIRANKVLAIAQKRLKKNKVFVPNFLGSRDTKRMLYFISEYINGKSLQNESTEVQYQAYLLAREYLKRITEVLTTKEIKTIGVRTKAYFAETGAVIFPIAIFKNLKEFSLFVKAGIKFAGSMFTKIKDKKTFVHGDLHPSNMIVKGKRIYIFDMEQSMITFSSYEDATSLSTPKVSKKLQKKIIDKVKTSRMKVLSLLMIHVNVYNMIGSLSKKNGKVYIQKIRQAIKLNI